MDNKKSQNSSARQTATFRSDTAQASSSKPDTLALHSKTPAGLAHDRPNVHGSSNVDSSSNIDEPTDVHDTLVQPLARTPRPKNTTTQTFKTLDFVDDRYLLEEKIGSGGMSEIYRALDTKHNNAPFAIKLISEEFSHHPHAFSALIREAKKTMSLAHPNILQVYGYGNKERYVYLVMELLEGTSLAEELKKDFDQFPFHARLNALIQLAQGLDFAHNKGIVHADLKPANLFLTPQKKLKILDFGIARAINEDLRLDESEFDVSKLKAFTLAYASPEMLRFEAPCVSDDIYALGIIASELLFSSHPFAGQDALTVIERNYTPVFPETRYKMFIPIVRKAIALTRTQRYASVMDFLQDLQSF
ncbi:Serine/threonine-protein kinase PknA [Thalassocella blandensis]|nr:Serine/threonine-protein kinase PknA [Thalassocella blandensis]